MERHSLKKIIKLLSTKKISEEELVKYYYSRIERHNPTLNAIVSLRNIDQVFDTLDTLKRYPSEKKKKVTGYSSCHKRFDRCCGSSNNLWSAEI